MGEGTSGTVPAIVILPDWDGVNSYEQQRADMVAEQFGWIGFAADIYGIDKHDVEDMYEKISLSTMYRSNQTLAASRIKAAIDTVKSLDSVNANQVGMIGYCFGGTLAITYGVTGLDEVVAIASYHGGLSTVPDSGPEIKPKMLILSGGDDDASSDIVDLEATFNAGNATWEITRYSNLEHSFTKFDSSAYNAWADNRSWVSMHGFMNESFGLIEYDGMEPNASNVVSVNYTDVDGTELRGYLALPEADKLVTPAPVVIVLPDWDGVNEYEQLRATMLADYGYIGFAADIYGKDLQEGLSFTQTVSLSTTYSGNLTLYVQRIQRAIELMNGTIPEADPENIAIIGYCFGGNGAIIYAFSGRDDVKIVVPFHGTLTSLPDSNVDIKPYVLVLSGGDDYMHGNQTVLEQTLDNASADWEITRYSQVGHGFTKWDGSDYSLTADARSWDSLMLVLGELLPLQTTTSTDRASGFILTVFVIEAILGFACM